MDMPEAVDPNAPHPADRAAGSTNGDSYDVSGTSSRDMVATLYETKSSIRDFDGKREDVGEADDGRKQENDNNYTIYIYSRIQKRHPERTRL